MKGRFRLEVFVIPVAWNEMVKVMSKSIIVTITCVIGLVPEKVFQETEGQGGGMSRYLSVNGAP